MALERKDVRAKLDPEVHKALKILCKAAGKTDAQYIEEILVPELLKRIHDATLIAAEATIAGITGNLRERSGGAGRGKE